METKENQNGIEMELKWNRNGTEMEPYKNLKWSIQRVFDMQI